MNPHLSHAIKTVLFRTGHYARRCAAVQFPGVAVLCYHGLIARRRGLPFEPLHVSPSTFDAHCRVIRASCNPVSLADLLAARNGGGPLPSRAVLVTFDDGYRSVFTLAKPILERYNIPATVFVCCEPIEWRRLFWYDAVARALGEEVVEQLKDVPFAEWLDTIQRFEVHAEDDDPYAPLSVDELRSLARAPGVEIGGHTLQHAILAHADPDEQWRQIVGNNVALQNWIQMPVRAFSYPNGRPGRDYTAASADIVKRAGCQAAFTTRSAYATLEDSRYELPRFLMLDSINTPALAHRFAYGWFGQQ